MTESQDVAAVPAPWTGAGGPYPAAPGPAASEPRPPQAASAPPEYGGAQPAQGTGAGQPREPRPAGTGWPGQVPAATGYAGAPPALPATGRQAAPVSLTTAGARQAGAPGSDADDEPYARVDARKLEAALLGVRKPVLAISLRLQTEGVEEARAERLKLLSQIDDYLLPRLRQSGAPILVALVGSTGAGKSTLLNSLAGRQVSATGIRRPTTNSPVLACHPNDMRWFAENVFLPTLPRVRQQGLVMPGRDGLLVLAATEGMPEGVAVLDTPDIDSVVKDHRDFANQFLDASDLWLFVTTARRYADAAVWEMLKDARDRGAALAVTLSRVPPQAAPQLSAHFEAMLEANGLREVRRFMIPETIINDARLPAEIAAPIQAYLADTARRDDRRVAVLTQTMSGVLDTFRDRVPALSDQAAAQLSAHRELRDLVDGSYGDSLTEFDEATRNGSLLQGEVLARWQDFAGTGDLLKTLQIRRGRGQAIKPRKQKLPARATALKAALHASLESLIIAMADRAAEHALAGWQDDPAGAALLADGAAGQAKPGAGAAQAAESDFVASALADLGVAGDAAGGAQPDIAALGRASANLGAMAARAVSTWQDHVRQLVREENVTKRSIARVASFDDESLALVLAIAVLGYGTTDVQIAEGASAVPQRLLTSLFGTALLRDIGVRVRQDLHERVGLLFDEEAQRFTAALVAAGPPDDTTPTELLQAGFTLESAR